MKTKIYIAKSANLVGDVNLEQGVNIWYGAVLRGDFCKINIGRNTNIQDNVVIHGEEGKDVIVSKNVTIGHSAVVHSAIIKENTLIGMNSTILSGAEIGKYSIIGANALVTEDKKIPEYSVVLGVPAKIVRKVTKEEIKMLDMHAQKYLELAKKNLN